MMELGSAACAVVLATAPRANGGPGPLGGVFWHASWTPKSVLGVGRGAKPRALRHVLYNPRSVSPSLLGREAQCWTRGSFPLLDPRWSLPQAGPGRAGQGCSSPAVGVFSRTLQSSQHLLGCRGARHTPLLLFGPELCQFLCYFSN